MNDFQQRQLLMYDAVISYLQDNRDVFSGVRAFSYTINKLRRTMDEIRRKEKELSSDILEKTIINAKVKDDLIFSVNPIASALFNYARETGDFQLKSKIKVGQSYYVRLRDSELMDKAELVRLLATNVLPRLKPFGVSMHTIHDLRLKIEDFRISLTNKVSSLMSSSKVMEMESMFDECNKYIKQLDSYVEVLGDDYPEFYDEYLESRDIDAHDAKKEIMDDEEADYEV